MVLQYLETFNASVAQLTATEVQLKLIIVIASSFLSLIYIPSYKSHFKKNTIHSLIIVLEILYCLIRVFGYSIGEYQSF